MIINKKNRFLFAELPRTGTTSISSLLITQFGGEKYYGDKHRDKRHISITNYIRSKNINTSDYTIISCVRNPLDRILSLFLKMKSDKNGYFSKLKRKKNKNIRQKYYLNIYNDIINNDLDFTQYFLKYHKLPYTDWMYSDSDLCEHIIRFENLSEDFNTVISRMNISSESNYVLPQKNVIQGKANFISFYKPDIQKRAQKIFGIYMDKFDYSFPNDWIKYKINLYDKIKFYLVNKIKWLYWTRFP